MAKAVAVQTLLEEVVAAWKAKDNAKLETLMTSAQALLTDIGKATRFVPVAGKFIQPDAVCAANRTGVRALSDHTELHMLSGTAIIVELPLEQVVAVLSE